MSDLLHSGKVGILVGGGPAPGINGVIAAATIEAIKDGAEMVGIHEGFRWLATGSLGKKHWRSLTIDDVSRIHDKGGSILPTSRYNPTKSEKDMANILAALAEQRIGALVTIGGDDTAFSACQVSLRGKDLRVAHVPKTIDNDLPLPGSTPTFGYETARQVGVGLVQNLVEDARTTLRWHLIVTMGRTAGHLALGIGKAAAVTLTLIPEEFRDRPVTLEEIRDTVVGSILKRRAEGSHYGVAVLAEGLLSAIGEAGLKRTLGDKLERYGKLKRDPFGNLRLAEIAFARMIKDLASERLEDLGLEVTITEKDLGYELRCADPVPFDAEYTRDLGYGAIKYLLKDEGRQGAIINFFGGVLQPLPFEDVIDTQTGKVRTRRVNVDGESFACALEYMIRLDRSDFADPEKRGALAAAAQISPEEFRNQFGYLVG
jgi:ATP-dependent phosphofructokinase / diphosphate-dependent phosphofructokinase